MLSEPRRTPQIAFRGYIRGYIPKIILSLRKLPAATTVIFAVLADARGCSWQLSELPNARVAGRVKQTLQCTVRCPGRPSGGRSSRLARLGRGEALDEIERGLRDLLPAVVDRERVASVRDLHDVRHPWITPLPFVGGVRD